MDLWEKAIYIESKAADNVELSTLVCAVNNRWNWAQVLIFIGILALYKVIITIFFVPVVSFYIYFWLVLGTAGLLSGLWWKGILVEDVDNIYENFIN